ncbi:Fur family transcriptional regulator [Desulfolucanica intricata]|uniref:Fur family transcriptional regulator n=1 Tax=Desulfolucanica intricata TaxID=1285191 RepID=UPI00082D7D5B|nr:Fur family transcriptional regulator [Desulfolucanica intricata]
MSMEDMLNKLKENGIKVTPQRQEVLRVFLENEKHYSAEEILKKVKNTFSNISLDTIYRTLSLFKGLGLINEVDFADGCRRFEINNVDGHHHHLVCLKCGRAEEVRFCPEDCLLKVQKQNPDFKVSGHTFKIFGYCPNCQ